ncbi:hypothetical protein A2884_01480 [Candidatus Saccharibacteria bacterium RIFCSPHIGHO2_01_FULL_48_12]|nr:MAG: hypothetical protein A2884_01480 [Candidatus Saccharibacteria bacterium RIFCSPHIGHO2_01_FULL_48_12]
MIKEFQKAYARLNQRQKEAVDTIDGLVLVVAGPGTGKTQLLSTRIANILQKTDTQPSSILALTYTNKAAVNMKERIIELAGPEGARVPASTFHSFAGEIMNLYPDYFWSGARLAIAPDSVQLDTIESIIGELPMDNPLALKFAGHYTMVKDVKSAISLAKDAGLTPVKLRALVQFNLSYIDKIEPQLVELLTAPLSIKRLPSLAAEIESLTQQEIGVDLYPLTALSTVMTDGLHRAVEIDLETGKCAQTSKWKSGWIQTIEGKKGLHAQRQRNGWWLKLADVYEQYRDQLHSRGFYDYADMLIEAIIQIEQNPQILADLQERFSYVLVDEFQDSTPAQIRLAHLIADHHSAEGKPNLMVVGDDDQTIFKFNGAEVNNMLNFENHYPDVKKIVLTDNYRSSQMVLDFCAKIIDQAASRVVNFDKSLKKDLHAKNPPKNRGEINALAYSSRELQMSQIAYDIKKTYSPKRAVAVLARNHESLIKMAGILNEVNVPIRYEQAANILEHEIIDQTYLVAKLLLAIEDGDNQAANALVHKIIRWPAWGLAPDKLWRLAVSAYPAKSWLDMLVASKEKPQAKLGQWFIWLAQQASSQPLAVTIEQILGLRSSDDFTSPIRDYFLGQKDRNSSSYFRGLSAIQLLRNLVHEFGPGRQPELADLIRFIEVNRQNNIIIPDESPFITGSGAVQLLTVYKAKGLEFDHVYVIDAIEDNWRPKSFGRKPPANLPLQPYGEDFDDYVRLMYVAVSRARASVTISGYYQDHSGKDVSQSPIIQSVQQFSRISQDKQDVLMGVLEQNLRWPSLEGGLEAEILKARLEEYNLSVTGLLNFLDIERGGPQYFKERNLLQLPETKSPTLSFGTAIHAALHKAQNLTNSGRFNLGRVTAEFERALADEQLPRAEFERRLTEGKRLLKRLFKDLDYKLPTGSFTELAFKNIRLGRAVISGKLDRVDRSDKNIMIADYKTGRPLTRFNTTNQAEVVKAYKHKLQLIFYVLLFEAKEGPMTIPITGEMVYVQAGQPRQLRLGYTPTANDIMHLTKLIEAVWDRVQRLDLPDTSQFSPNIDGILAFEKYLLEQ